ncbi:4Fe-4S single cluster domain-containing protein [Oxynema aestuarii]|jgi:anaerobic ribonucleoside-triphosphate reductase activating protein|uniref:Radical SAM protein n=1 Tax=Oxynema aestuarii AP17 TaxID=2064643 RepID=A0A6H1TZN3_9CYAN|nr:4Fe-4S single cluster domain-containing protein [Oxynema aestuarii]QIZ71233.1 radical SAM protein [Oxynema aestuarii AP17]RMH76057.1 MAG: radical SAM protein [Cyanobacteria bacterium J007]
MSLLNLAELCPATRTLGPGRRFAIWVQGCCFNCPGCVSPDWIDQKTAHLVEVQTLGDLILNTPNLDGLTVSGGEPMLQVAALNELCLYLRQRRDLSIICFTGFTLKQLKSRQDPQISTLLAAIDVLIDGQYLAEYDDNRGLRGSSNQQVHFLTSRHLPEKQWFDCRRRDVEVRLRGESALMVGVPPHGFSDKFKLAVDRSC